MTKAMKPNRPYLLRAYYDWIVDSECTPHIVVDATVVGTEVPQQFVQDGQIILNINPGAVAGFVIGDKQLQFNARFGGNPFRVVVPLAAVMAIYARENGEGTAFAPLSDEELIQLAPEDDEPTPEPPKPTGKVSHLKVVK